MTIAAYRLALALGGMLTISNRDDGGTGVCFQLALPIEVPASAAVTGQKQQHKEKLSPLGGRRRESDVGPGPLRYHVLVVDDSATNRRIAERALRALGCTCTLAEDGDEVPDAVARERFDVLLLDIRMSRVNGDAACASLRAGGYTGPIIAVTGNATLLDAAEYRRGGFTATLGKPFGAAELRACLEALARRGE